jgi:transglutaminase-like putative cysteine protease
MRSNLLFRCLMRLGLFFAIAGVAAAAKPPDWLAASMKEPLPLQLKAHDAIRLLDYEQVRYLSHDRTRRLIRGALKIKTQAGLMKASISQAYLPEVGKVRSAKAWIVKPGGKSCQAFAKADFLDIATAVGAFEWNSSRLLTLPMSYSLDVGSTLAWEFELDTLKGVFDSRFQFQNAELTVRSVFEVEPAAGTTLSWFAPSPALSSPVPTPTGGLRWSMENIAGLQHDFNERRFVDGMSVSVRCIPSTPSAQTIKTWSDLAAITSELIEPKAAVTPVIKAKAEALIAGKQSRWERIRAVTEFVQKDITYLSITQDSDVLAGYRPHAAAEVLANRFGDCKDKATFLAALLRAIGDNAYVVIVYSGNPRAIQSEWPAAAFNHAVAAIPADDACPSWWPIVDGGALGRLVLFDPTNAHVPLGVLPREDQGGFGLICHRAGSLVAIPHEEAGHCGLTRTIHVTLDQAGGMLAQVEEAYLGTEGAEVKLARENLRREKFAEALLARIQRNVPMARDVSWAEEWDPEESRFRLTFTFKADRQLRALGKGRFMLNPETMGEVSRMPSLKRDFSGVLWEPVRTLEDRAIIVLPEAFAAADLPPAWTAEADGFQAKVECHRESGQLVFTRTLSTPAGFLNQEVYDLRRKHVDSFLVASRRPVLLERAGTR